MKMFYQGYYGSIKSQQIDGFNAYSSRTIKNTPKGTYNCAGYALETFSWYCPSKTMMPWRVWNRTKRSVYDLTRHCIKQMLNDFPDLRVIKNLDEVKENEYPILFRCSTDGDFHFLKRARNGNWYEKRGNGYDILHVKKENLFDTWIDIYDGPIVIFAKERK